MFSCDYNGWVDVPEEEREALEAFESAAEAPVELPPSLFIVSESPASILPHHKAA